jgi:phospholipid/cholesterol/gamma-HCH transport system ATP-binding protein
VAGDPSRDGGVAQTSPTPTPEPGRSAVICVDSLVAGYGERTVLDGISLDVEEGEIRVIMGGSGSGKTTLLRCLLGLKEHTGGTVEVLGKPFGPAYPKNMRAVRKQMGVAFQTGALFGSMTVRENIQLPLRQHTRLDHRTMDIMARIKLELVNLGGCEDLMPSELSGGMVKRAAFARAMIMDPKLLIFDEPSAGLDPVTSAELDALITELRAATQATMVVVTHELDSALSIADRITILGEGKVLMTGTVEEIRSSPDQRVQDLLNRRIRSTEFDAEAYFTRLTEVRQRHR